jgi:antitoxin MazE
MKTRLVRIGNSRGLRLPKPLIEELGFAEEVELDVRAGTLVIRPHSRARAGWAEAAAEAAGRGEAALIDEAPGTRFDREEWAW